jgi:anti-anti-sigma factor
MEQLVVEVDGQAAGAPVVAVRGEVRLDAKALEAAFMRVIAGHPKSIILDLSGLSFLSSLGMGSFVSLRNALKRTGGQLIVCGTRPIVMDALKRARLENLFAAVCDTVDAGVQIARGQGNS